MCQNQLIISYSRFPIFHIKGVGVSQIWQGEGNVFLQGVLPTTALSTFVVPVLSLWKIADNFFNLIPSYSTPSSRFP